MNKWLVSITGMVAAGASMAAVESANTVGYTEQAIAAGTYYMVGAQFEKVGGASGIAFDDLISFSGVSACGYDDQSTDAAEIDVLAGGAYESYYYINDAFDENDEDVGHDCWAFDGYECTAADIQALGNGFWLKVPAAAISGSATLKTAGQVSAETSLAVSFPGSKTYAMISNPFPVATALQDVVTTGVTACGYDDQSTDAAEIDVLAGGAYESYYYISDAFDENDEDVGHDCWAFDGYECTGTQVPAGASFWIKSPSAGSITFSL